MRSCSKSGCFYPVFSTDKKTGRGYCKMHQSLRTDRDTRTIFQKHMDKMKKDGKKEKEVDQTELQKWYAEIMQKEEGRCWETGEKINKTDRRGWHGSISHVLPKADYPSVATHPLNYMILKMWGGTHGQYDSNWENASKMKIWPYACKIFNILYPLLTREEKGRLPDIITQEIKPEIYNR